MLTAEQRAARRRGITATDIPAILGVHPWKGAADVWRDKLLGEVSELDGNARVDWGNRLEDPIRGWYAATMRVDVEVPGTLWHHTDEIAAATPDGIVYPPGATDPRNGLEIKSHTISLQHLYGEPGTDQVPVWELVQCAWNLYVTGLPWWHLVAFIDGLPRVYRIDRDRDLEADLAAAARRFWDDHVVTGRRPPPDGSASYAADLLKRWPGHAKDELVEAAAADLAAIRELRSVADQLAALQRREELLEQTIKERIGDASGITWREGARADKITWRRSKDSTPTDWEAVAREIAATANLQASGTAAALDNAVRDGIITESAAAALRAAGITNSIDTAATIAAHTKITPGSRRFCRPRSWSRDRE